MTISHPQVTYGLILSYGSSGDYSGWDRFGRIVDAKMDRRLQTPCYDTKRTIRPQQQHDDADQRASFGTDETYSYDGLDRLTSMTRDGSAYQSWTLDGTGNWTSFTDQGNTETRTHNEANEITAIDSNSVTYDEAGNLTQGPKPAASGNQVYVYDGWNRLIQVKETGGSVIVTYEYDSRGNRIEKTVGSDTYDYFHNEASQVVEVRLNDDTDPLERFVWDIGFVDTLVTAIRDTDTNGTIDQRAFYLWDATRNTTAITFASWSTVAERIHYDAYGKAQFYTASWSTKSGTSYGVVNTFTGRELDTESGLYYFRARYYDPALGRFISRDPLGYVNGMSLYRAYFVQGGVDPSGLDVRAVLDLDEDAPGYRRDENGNWPKEVPRHTRTEYPGRYDAWDAGADFGTGYNDVMTIGVARGIQKLNPLYEGDMTNESSIAYKGGVVVGAIHSAAIGAGAAGTPGVIAGGTEVSGLTKGAWLFLGVHTTAGIAQSGGNIATGNGSFWDLVPFLPIIGYGTRKIAGAFRRSSEAKSICESTTCRRTSATGPKECNRQPCGPSHTAT